jgi:predicted permease
MERLVWGCVLVLGSLLLGNLLEYLRILNLQRRNFIIRWTIKGFSPVVLCLSLWGMDFRDPQLWILPLLGIFLSLALLVPAVWYVRAERYGPAQRGSFLTCAFFSNVGYFGAIIAFAVFGEAAYALCQLYLMLFTPCFYTIGFWLAARYAKRGGDLHGRGISAELRFIPLIGIAGGVVLSLIGLPRPASLAWLNQVLIPLYTALYLMAIGAQFRLALGSRGHLSFPRAYWKPCLVMCLLKFVYAPLVGWLCCEALGLGGLVRIVVLLEASTPVAVSPLLFPMLFGLDQRLSNILWFSTTLVAVPWFFFLVQVVPWL